MQIAYLQVLANKFSIEMKFVAILLLGALAVASALAPAAEQQLLQQIIAQGPASEAPEAEAALARSSYREYYKINLYDAPGANSANRRARAVFEYWPTDSSILWKLTVYDFIGFTGAHLHYSDPGMGNPIWVHLVPHYGDGDFVSPRNYGIYTWNGIFRTEELSTHGVYSINSFLENYVAKNKIYINVHGINKEPDLTAYLNYS